MRLLLLSILALFLIESCTQKETFPEKILTRLNMDELLLETEITNVHISNSPIDGHFDPLFRFVKEYEAKDVNFSLTDFINTWAEIYEHENFETGSASNLVQWVEITGLLLELTGDEKFAAALERMSNGTNKGIGAAAPFIFSKRLDHIYVNLFEPAEINYNHTLGGKVNFRQETDYPNSGKIKLHFGMTERRYMELFIRIPDWAEGSTVTVKQVKYFAHPGEYCKIAKKWKEGDLVEIEFPIHLRKENKDLISSVPN